MSEPLDIVLRGVTKRFGSHLVLDAVELAVKPGETVALIGPSGGGKSTLLRCINGLNTFDSGEIRVGRHTLSPLRRGEDAAAQGGARRWFRAGRDMSASRLVCRLVGMIFQDFQLFPHRTAVENIMEAPRHVLGLGKAEARVRAMRLLDRVGLVDRAGAYPRELSGGQKQRVAIARAMAMEPRALLCDEITSALDPELKCEVLDVLADLKRDGLTLIVVTHEIGFARRTADRIVVLAEGRILESGTPQQLLDTPGHPRTRQFLAQVLA